VLKVSFGSPADMFLPQLVLMEESFDKKR